jgi:hypothetical protein
MIDWFIVGLNRDAIQSGVALRLSPHSQKASRLSRKQFYGRGKLRCGLIN